MEEQKKKYALACEYMNEKNAIDDDYIEAAELFEELGDYEDAAEQAAKCRALAEGYREKLAAGRRKSRLFGRLIALLVVLLCVGGIIGMKTAGDIGHCRQAKKYEAVRDFAGVNEELSQVNDRLVGWLYANRYRYAVAERMMFYEDYESAVSTYQALGSYKDSEEKLPEANYALAMSYLAENRYQMTYQTLALFPEYKDSAEIMDSLPERCYAYAESCYEAGDLKTARNCFDHKFMKYYKDSSERAFAISYEYGCDLLEQGLFEQAEDALNRAQNTGNAPDKLNELYYLWAKSLIEQGELNEAVKKLTPLRHYRDSYELKCECSYQMADAFEKEGKTADALKLFTDLGEYKDSADRVSALQKDE